MNVVPLSKDAVHIYIGLVVFFAAVALWKRGRIQFACLVPVSVVALGMEAFDLFDDYRSFGYLRWDASLHDVVNTVFWPVLIVMLVKLGAIDQKNPGRRR